MRKLASRSVDHFRDKTADYIGDKVFGTLTNKNKKDEGKGYNCDNPFKMSTKELEDANKWYKNYTAYTALKNNAEKTKEKTNTSTAKEISDSSKAKETTSRKSMDDIYTMREDAMKRLRTR